MTHQPADATGKKAAARAGRASTSLGSKDPSPGDPAASKDAFVTPGTHCEFPRPAAGACFFFAISISFSL
ncbi:hypothetical protein RNI52_14000 [Labrys neptuniae]|uniref:hypothetical protein n=1 Tax=Labrys neptuniae TaxID=376174 RepID=UPI00288EFBB5|nr:hypothetical protein [Labrys neptuniae]MDT3378439.1 hypothetical protein [Labrys neptuniae]